MKLKPNLTLKELQKAKKTAEKEIKEWESFLSQVKMEIHEKTRKPVSKLSIAMVKAGFPICYGQTHCKSCVDVYRRKYHLK